MPKKLVHLRTALAPKDHIGLHATAMIIANSARDEGARPESIRVARHSEDGPWFRPRVLLEISWVIPDRRKAPVSRANEVDIRAMIAKALY